MNKQTLIKCCGAGLACGVSLVIAGVACWSTAAALILTGLAIALVSILVFDSAGR